MVLQARYKSMTRCVCYHWTSSMKRHTFSFGFGSSFCCSYWPDWSSIGKFSVPLPANTWWLYFSDCFKLIFNLQLFMFFHSIMIFSMASFRAKLLSTRNRMVPHSVARQISNKLDVGDWWLIYMLSRNLDPMIFKDVLEQLLHRLDMRSSPHARDEKS